MLWLLEKVPLLWVEWGECLTNQILLWLSTRYYYSDINLIGQSIPTFQSASTNLQNHHCAFLFLPWMRQFKFLSAQSGTTKQPSNPSLPDVTLWCNFMRAPPHLSPHSHFVYLLFKSMKWQWGLSQVVRYCYATKPLPMYGFWGPWDKTRPMTIHNSLWWLIEASTDTVDSDLIPVRFEGMDPNECLAYWPLVLLLLMPPPTLW